MGARAVLTRFIRCVKGATSLEMALIFPVLMLIVFGIMEFGYYTYIRTTVAKAAHIGARYGITGRGEVEGTRYADIKRETRRLLDVMTGGSDDGLTIQVKSLVPGESEDDMEDGNPGGPCDMLEVSVKYGYTPIIPLLRPILPETLWTFSRERMINEPWNVCK